MDHTPKTYITMTLEAPSHADLREQVRRVAEDMGLLRGQSTPAVNPTTPAAEQGEPEQNREPEAQAQDEKDTDPNVPLVWYHKPESQEVWQEPEQKRRKGIVKVDEATAERLIADYDAAAAGAADDKGDSEDQGNLPLEGEHQPANEEDDEPGDWDETPADEDVTLDDVKKAVGAYAQENGNKSGKDLVASFGVAKLSELDPEQYAAVVKKAGGLR